VNITNDSDLEMITNEMTTNDEELQKQTNFVTFDFDDENNVDLNDDYYF
jgi:hypothetical protein